MGAFEKALESDGRAGLSDDELRPVYDQVQDVGLTDVRPTGDSADLVNAKASDGHFYEEWDLGDRALQVHRIE